MNRFESLAATGAALLVAGTLLSGSTAEQAPAPTALAHLQEVDPAPVAPALPGSEAAYNELPSSPCQPGPFESDASAQRCLDAYSGKVDVVDFGNTPGLAEQVAEAQKGLAHASRGILKLTFAVIPASNTAKAALHAERCVDTSTDLAGSASAIAQETMGEELKDASFVVGVSDVAPCDVSEARPAGASDHMHNALDLYPQNSVDGEITSTLEHEAGHIIVDLGHAGVAVQEGTVDLTSLQPNTTTDIATLASGLTHDVYGVGPVPNPMSSVAAAPDELSFSLTQLDSLQWPYRKLGEQFKPYTAQLNPGDSMGINCQTALEGRAVTMEIPPVSFGDTDHQGDSYTPDTFGELVFEPAADASSGKCETAFGDLELYDPKSATTVRLASLTDNKPTNQAISWNLVVGDKRVTITEETSSFIIGEK